jgi:hypothetical protein
MTGRTIPYTHWAYFPDRSSAEACARDLPDYVIRIQGPEDCRWLLRAGRDVEVGHMVERHREVEEIVVRHGGDYDGGENSRLEGDSAIEGMTGEG